MGIGAFGQPKWKWKHDPTGFRPIHLDPTTHSQVVTEAEHHEIHEGHMWHYETNATIDIITPLDIVFTTPAADITAAGGVTNSDGTWECSVHWASAVTSTAQVLVEVVEGVTTIVGGSAGTAYNRNRNATHSLNTTIILEPASYVGGTVIESQLIGQSGNPTQRVGGLARTNVEWMFLPSTSYVLRITAAADSTTVNMFADFYEHFHKDNWDEGII